METAKEALRGLIDKIELQPVAGPEGKPMLAVDLHGALAGLLRLAVGLPVNGSSSPARGANSDVSAEADLQVIDIVGELVLVAGTGFEPVTFRL
jgi:site-specific DNA recombinase